MNRQPSLADLKELLDERGTERLGDLVDSIGITSFTLEDDIYLLPATAAKRHRVEPALQREMLVGDALRDWSAAPCDIAVFPYDAESLLPVDLAEHLVVHQFHARRLWAQSPPLKRRTSAIAQKKLAQSSPKHSMR